MDHKLSDSTREKLEVSVVNAGGFREPITMLLSTVLMGGLANYVFPGTVWALPVGMLVGFAGAFVTIKEERDKRRLTATKMSDDALISFHEEREKDRRQMTIFLMIMACVVTLLIGIFVMGLLFTEQGQEMLRGIGEPSANA